MIIVEKEIDMAGKYRVVVEIDNTLRIPLKFNEEVSDEVVYQETERTLELQKLMIEENGITNEI